MIRTSHSRRGGVLVQVLIVLTALVALMVSLAATQRASLGEVQHRLSRRRAEIAARSAVARALSVLQSADTNLVTLADDWATLGDRGNEVFELGDATFRLEIVDAGALVNVNTATEEQLRRLPVTEEQVDSLLDWREDGQQARANGAKDDYYGGLDVPYEAARQPLATLTELLLVRGWTARSLYLPQEDDIVNTALDALDDAGNALPLAGLLTTDGGAPNTRVDGTAKVNLNVAQLNGAALTQFGINPQIANQVAAGGPYTTMRELLIAPGVTPDVQRQLLDGATTVPTNRLEGKINVNTATQAVLETLPGMTSDIAASLVSRQSAGLASLGDLVSVPGLSGVVLSQIADAVAVGSDTWIVRAYGSSGAVGVAVEAVVGMRDGRMRVITWNRLPNSRVPSWWNWQTDDTAANRPPTLGARP